MLKSRLPLLLCSLSLIGCSNTQEENAPTIELTLSTPNVVVAPNEITLATSHSDPVITRSVTNPQAEQRKHPLMDKTVCRNDTFHFFVKDQNGFKNKYSAKVQAQGKITQVHAEPWVTVEIINWYSEDTLLQQWRGHLDHVPFNQQMKLEAGQTYRQQISQWQFCKLDY